MAFELSKHQKIVASGILQDLLSSVSTKTGTILSLAGSAGVGKTYLTSYLVEELLKQNLRIGCTAPTHKAVKVLKKHLEPYIDDISCSTIHAFLKLKLKPDYNKGIHTLVQDTFTNNTGIPVSVDVLIIDEMSMISENLFTFIKAVVKSGKVKAVLLIGDSMQLTPVDNSSQIVHDADVKQYRLTEIVRQAQDNSIIQESVFLRDCIESKQYVPIVDILNQAKENIFIINNYAEFVDTYVKDTSDKILASYTNNVVNSYNNEIRYKILGDVPMMIPGETLVLQEAYVQNNKILMNNNDEVVIKSCHKYMDFEKGIEYWEVESVDNPNFYVVDENSLTTWKGYLDNLKKIAISAEGNSRTYAWKKYFAVSSKYLSVKHNYASTIHKLQGSTYENIYIDYEALINSSADLDTLYRLIYVAITRASLNVYLFRQTY